MLNINPPDFKYCPFCATELSVKKEEGKDRKFCHNCKWHYYPHVSGAACALVVKESKVLLVQRAREPHKGKWMMPAGFLDYGEHPSECAKREVLEETGYTATSAKLLDIIQVIDDNRPGTEGHFGFMYKVEIEASEPKEISDTEENLAVEWHDIDKLPPIAWESHARILDRISKQLL